MTHEGNAGINPAELFAEIGRLTWECRRYRSAAATGAMAVEKLQAEVARLTAENDQLLARERGLKAVPKSDEGEREG